MAMSKRKFSTILAETCNTLNIPRENIIICMGGASLIHGLRHTTNDIDLMLIDNDRAIFNRLIKAGYKLKSFEQTGLMSAADVISVGVVDLHWYDEIDSNYQYKNYRGYKLATRYSIFIDRIKLGCDKDIDEIEKLSEYYNHLLPAYLKERYYQLVNKTI